MKKLLCLFKHQYFVAEEFDQHSRKVGCKRCGRFWGMNDWVRSFLPWDDELERLHKFLKGGATTIAPVAGTKKRSLKMSRIVSSIAEDDRNGTFCECGSYETQLTGFKESELCETRQDYHYLKAIVASAQDEAAEQKARAEKAEAELAKRERALEDAPLYLGRQTHWLLIKAPLQTANEKAAEVAPHYAEWLKNREEKK